MTIQFQRLLDVCRATETLPLGGFDMDEIFCGTAGCMIGNYSALVGRKPGTFGDVQKGVLDWEHFGISQMEYTWLFDRVCTRERSTYITLVTNWLALCNARSGGKGYCIRDIKQREALARLRKFIAYKRRKHAMIHDPKYGVRDEARHAEGNQLFAVLAVQDALQEASVAVAT